jgi:pimeloyl-ACP methyl ester carboxylesterase
MSSWSGQSYGGMVVTGVVDRVPERLRRLVYVDAFVPFDGQSCNELCGDAWTTRMRELADEQGDGWLVPLPFAGNMGLSDEVAAWYLPRLVPHPLATLDDRLAVTGAGAGVPRSYLHLVEAEDAADQGPTAASAAHARDAGWDYSLVVGPHDLHVEDPARMVDLLRSLLES